MNKIFKFREAGILFALIGIWVITAIFNPRFLSFYNLQVLSRQIAVFGLIAIGETFVILTGGIDLSPGSVIALTSVLAAFFINNGFGIFGATFITILIAFMIGLWHGLFITKLGIPPFIITLGTFAIGRGFATVLTKGWPIINIPNSFSFIWDGIVFRFIPFPVLILLVVSAISIFILTKTIYGRHIYAVGGNIEAARLSGIDVDSIRVFTYIFSAVLSGVVGVMLTSRLKQGNPNVGVTYEMYAIAASVIGGTSLFGGIGTIVGALIGAGILTAVWNSLVLLEVSSYWHQVILGFIIVISVTIDVLREKLKEV
ncbi:MAG: ABC transporter permease [candidate division WOR-3 bacterium]